MQRRISHAIRLFVIATFLALIVTSRLQSQEVLRVDVVAERSDQRGIKSLSSSRPFYIVITNLSRDPVTIWREWCSWGYGALTFDVRLSDGTITKIEKIAGIWDRNFPDPYLIPPNGHSVIQVSLKGKWSGLPETAHGIDIQAHFEIPVDPEQERYKVWSGKISSPWITVQYSP
jgi:hypothetical protein